MWSDVMCDLTWGGEYCSWWYLWNDDSNTVLLTRNASSHRTSSYHNIVFLHWSKNIQSSKMIACKNFVQFRIMMSSDIAGHLFENKRMYIWIWIVVRNLTFDKSLLHQSFSFIYFEMKRNTTNFVVSDTAHLFYGSTFLFSYTNLLFKCCLSKLFPGLDCMFVPWISFWFIRWASARCQSWKLIVT